MKSHKYWSLGALFCMLGCIYSGIKKSMTAHKYFCLFFIALYGHVHLFRSQTGFSKEEKNH